MPKWAENAREEYRRRCLSGVLAHKAEGGGGNDRFRSVSHLQRLEDGGDVNFHRRFGQVEHAGDGLVALPCIIRASTSTCRSVKPRSAAEAPTFAGAGTARATAAASPRL